MNKTLSKIFGISAAVCLWTTATAQTAGTLAFSYTPTSHTCYTGSKNVLAIWIQDANGNFIKTRLRNVGSGTRDHLPTWAVNAGGSSSNALSSACNVVSATTGATLNGFTVKNIAWDGTDVNGNVVADGTYKITIQSTWNHGSAGTATRSFTFTKGTVADNPTFANDGNFTGISLSWTPQGSTAGLSEGELTGVKVFPVPSNDGFVTVEFAKASSVKVYNTAGMLVSDVAVEADATSVQLDLSTFDNGSYVVLVSDGALATKQTIVLNK